MVRVLGVHRLAPAGPHPSSQLPDQRGPSTAVTIDAGAGLGVDDDGDDVRPAPDGRRTITITIT